MWARQANVERGAALMSGQKIRLVCPKCRNVYRATNWSATKCPRCEGVSPKNKMQDRARYYIAGMVIAIVVVTILVATGGVKL